MVNIAGLADHHLALRVSRSIALSDTDSNQAAAHIMMLAWIQAPISAMCPAVAPAATLIAAPVMPTISWQVRLVSIICLALLKRD